MRVNGTGSDAVKIIMTSSISDNKSILHSFRDGCEGFLVKPVTKEALDKLLRKLKFKDANG